MNPSLAPQPLSDKLSVLLHCLARGHKRGLLPCQSNGRQWGFWMCANCTKIKIIINSDLTREDVSWLSRARDKTGLTFESQRVDLALPNRLVYIEGKIYNYIEGIDRYRHALSPCCASGVIAIGGNIHCTNCKASILAHY